MDLVDVKVRTKCKYLSVSRPSDLPTIEYETLNQAVVKYSFPSVQQSAVVSK